MRKLSIALFSILAISRAASGLNFSGYSRTGAWIETNGSYGLSYSNTLDLMLSATLPKDLEIQAGARYQLDEETWETSTRARGITKRFLLLRHEYLSARIGNYNATLGRGLILSCLDEPRLKVDRDIEGVLVDGSYLDVLEARALTGRIRENSTEIDSTLTYTGLQVKASPVYFLALGAAYLRANAGGRTSDPSYGRPAEELFGGNVGATGGPFELYAEYGLRHTYGLYVPLLGWIGTDDIKGDAIYGSLSFSMLGLGISVDGKRYRHFDARINAPPPCNQDGRLLNNANDERGFSVDGTASPARGLAVHGNYSWARDGADRQRWEDSYAEGRAEMTKYIVITAEARARSEEFLQPDIQLKHYKGGVVGCQWRYRPGNSLSVKAGLDRYRNRYSIGPLSYSEWQGTMEWTPLPWAGLTLSGELANRRVSEYNDQRSWNTVSLLLEPFSKQRVEITFGSTKGGLVCSNGYCRYEPAFKGWKAIWEWKF